MATSGTIGQTAVDITTIFDHAMRRCRLTASQQTPEIIQLARENLFFTLSDLANIGLNLWCIDKIIVGLLKNKESYALPEGTVDVLNVFLRSSPRSDGILTSSDSQPTTTLEDGDVTTFLSQGVAGGNFQVSFTSSQAVRTVGILHRGSATRSLIFEVSEDAISWSSVFSVGQASYSEGTWYWYDIDPAKMGRFFRVRDALTNAPLSAYEFYTSVSGTEMEASRISRDEFTNLPNKFSTGQPLQFWFDRQAFQPIVRVWPSPDNIYDQLVIWRHRQVQDVGTDLTLQVEVPQRWSEAVISMLSYKLSLEIPMIDKNLLPVLKSESKEALARAEVEEVDNSPMTLRPNLSHYTRG